MDQYFRFIISGLLSLILFSCAQLGIIEGGEKDIYAPKIIKSIPLNASTKFNSPEIIIEFDEYFKLNNAQENIIVLPADLKVEAQVHKKKLILKLLNQPSANTTYQISLNNLVKDISESNDSLMQYVFSTGENLDSIQYSGTVIDAYTSQVIDQVLVGLYDPRDTITSQKPLYFTKTNAQGKFQLNFLKSGSFAVYAIQDANKSLTYQPSEKAGFRDSLLKLEQNHSDSNYLNIFPGEKLAKITFKQFVSPRLMRLKAGFPLYVDSMQFDGKTLDKNLIFNYSSDSIAILLPTYPNDSNLLLIKNKGIWDTIQIRKPIKFTLQGPEIFPKNKEISQSKSTQLLFNDRITKVDSSMIIATTMDSIVVTYKSQTKENQLFISFVDSLQQDVKLLFRKGAITYENGTQVDSFSVNYILKPEANFGSLIFKSAKLPERAIVEFLLNKKVVKTVSLLDLKTSLRIPYLEPGEYTFRIIIDQNENGQWDAGNVIKHISSEKVLQFPEKVKIRANWESEIEFEIKP